MFKRADDRKSGLVAKLVGLSNPAHTGVPFAGFVTASSTGGTLALDLPLGGTRTVTLGATSTSGNPGTLVWSYALKKPNGGVYSAD